MMTLSAAAKIMNGQLTGKDQLFTSVCTDSRSIATGALFVALKGDRFDGHDFVEQSRSHGATGALVDHFIDTHQSCIRADNTLTGLQQLAATWRSRFTGRVIGVTGSNGKTTVKEMVGAILSKFASTLISEGNLNNHIGVPLSLLRLNQSHRFAVIEMGMNHSGELTTLTEMVRPDIAIITNAAEAHLEGLGSVDRVAKAKAEIFLGLKDGVGVICGDDPFAPYWQSQLGANKCRTFGLESGNDLQASVEYTENASTIDFDYRGRTLSVRLGIAGKHNVLNALAAITVAELLDINSDCVVSGLESFQPVKGRGQTLSVLGKVLIDDSYNANPASLNAAIAVLSQYKGCKMLVLGDMGELGAGAAEFHSSAGLAAKHAGVDILLTVGPLSKHAAIAFGEPQHAFTDMEELIGEVKKRFSRIDVMLVKASRSMRMERLVNTIINMEEVA
jgi:UDP-N-acetylmuramoyl-tripeptide--D-alanyl-D-alanine ligase